MQDICPLPGHLPPDLVEGQVNHGALRLWFVRPRSTLTYLLNPYLTHARPCNVIDMLRRVRNCRTIIIIIIIRHFKFCTRVGHVKS